MSDAVWLMIVDHDDGVDARAFTTRDAAIRAIRALFLEAEGFDPDTRDAAMVRWDKFLADLPDGNTVLQTDWDSQAVIILQQATIED